MKNNINVKLFAIAGESARKEYNKARSAAVKTAAEQPEIKKFLKALSESPLSAANAVFAAEVSAFAKADKEELEAEAFRRKSRRDDLRQTKMRDLSAKLDALGERAFCVAFGLKTYEKIVTWRSLQNAYKALSAEAAE